MLDATAPTMGKLISTMRRICLMILGIALLAAPAAQAGVREDRAKAIAQKVWHHPCVDQMQIRWADRASFLRFTQGHEFKAAADIPGCRVVILAGQHMGFAEFCTVVLHEAGHLAGMGHSTNPKSIMYFEDDRTYATILGREVGGDPRCNR